MQLHELNALRRLYGAMVRFYNPCRDERGRFAPCGDAPAGSKVKAKESGGKAPEGNRIVVNDVRNATKTITREGRIGSVKDACGRLEALEKQVDDAHFKNGVIDRAEYREMSGEINNAWKDLGQSYDAELYNKNSVTGSKVVKEISVHPDVTGATNAIGHASPEMQKQLNDAHEAMRDGAQSVYSRMSTSMGKRVGPIESIQIVRNDHPALAGESGRLDNICAYDSKTKSIYVSSACSTPEQIKYATSFAATQHVYENAPASTRDDLYKSYNARVKGGDLKTDKYGESAPYKDSKSFWSSYQGVVPETEVNGVRQIDMNHAGMHMATVSYATLTSGQTDKVAAILRDPAKRSTLFDSMKVFSKTVKAYENYLQSHD